jgi:hypothetical protein
MERYNARQTQLIQVVQNLISASGLHTFSNNNNNNANNNNNNNNNNIIINTTTTSTDL